MASSSKHPAHPRTSRLRIGLITLAALTGASILAWQGAEPAAGEVDEHANADAVGLARRTGLGVTTAMGGPCSFVPGTRMAYEVRSRTRVELQPGSLAGGIDVGSGPGQVVASPTINRDIERDWGLELEALALDAEGTSTLAARIEDRGIRSFEGEAPSASPALSDTFLIRVDARCGLVEFGWRDDGDLDGAREQQIMVGGLGFVAPATLGELTRYAAPAFDLNGRY
ncbi:MAG: hypothetical protein KC431_26640 [Myxococcales bacterium]|nr:hypothetical protein [Myxococcales bacterium]